jgi:peptidoglycan/LPS O-acetylase OafA/YrhL
MFATAERPPPPPLHPLADAASTRGSALRSALASPRIGGLDFLRAVSVLLVLVEHALDFRGASPLKKFVLGTSSLGVEVFFVLSGFLITWMLAGELQRKRSIDYVGFYRRRIARLMPVFFLYIFVVVGYLSLQHRPVPWGAVTAAMLYVVNYYQAFSGATANLV